MKKYLFVEKYRPQTVAQCILPKDIKKTFLDFVKSGDFPNLVLSGAPGSGKTSIARALCHDLDMEMLFINGSKDRNIETIRVTMQDFASVRSINKKRKVVIIDEFDGMSGMSQDAMKGFIEEFKSVRFIFTVNNVHKVIDPIISRSTTIDFSVPEDERTTLMIAYITQIFDILTKENISADKKVVAALMKKYFPDFRRTLNEIQKHSVSGTIDISALNTTKTAGLDDLMVYLKANDWPKVRQWAATNYNYDPCELARNMYGSMNGKVRTSDLPQLAMVFGEYLKSDYMVKDKEVNMAAMLATIMTGVQFV